jgi:choline dehydrogenase
MAPEPTGNITALLTPSPVKYPGNYFSMLAVLEHPFSRGSVHITSSDPSAYPAIDPNYLAHPLDLQVLSQILLHLQQVARTPPLSNHLKDGGLVFAPGFYELDESNVEAFARDSFSTEYHPMGTCPMGPRHEGGVVDERLRVHGTRNLRVVDASVFPLQVRGNLASLVYAVAERAADFVKEDARS